MTCIQDIELPGFDQAIGSYRRPLDSARVCVLLRACVVESTCCTREKPPACVSRGVGIVMAALESKGAENGDVVAPSAADAMAVEVGRSHQPSEETIAEAEALKAEGNQLLAGEIPAIILRSGMALCRFRWRYRGVAASVGGGSVGVRRVLISRPTVRSQPSMHAVRCFGSVVGPLLLRSTPEYIIVRLLCLLCRTCMRLQ